MLQALGAGFQLSCASARSATSCRASLLTFSVSLAIVCSRSSDSRNCFMDHSKSKRRANFFLRCIGPRVTNLLHLGDYQIQLFVLRVKVWRDAHSRAGAIVNDEFAANQLFGDRAGVLVPNRD